jgi:hypothetical protein
LLKTTSLNRLNHSSSNWEQQARYADQQHHKETNSFFKYTTFETFSSVTAALSNVKPIKIDQAGGSVQKPRPVTPSVITKPIESSANR